MPVGADDVASGPSRYPCDAASDASRWWHAERACAEDAMQAERAGADESADDLFVPSGAASDASWWWHAERACDDAVERRLPYGADDEQDSCCALGASDAWP